MERGVSDWDPPIARAPGEQSGIGVPEAADLERRKPNREASQCETPEAPLRQEWDEIAAARIEMAGNLG